MYSHILSLLLILFLGYFPAATYAATNTLNWIGHFKNEGKREQLVMEVKKEFEFLHPEVTVNFIFNGDLPGPGTYFKDRVAKTIIKMIKTGNITWDVVHLDHAIYHLVADELGDPDWGKKHLVDFSRVPGFLDTVKPEILNEPFYTNQAGDMLIGPYVEGYIFALWYNRTLAEKIGITVKERNMTVENFLSYAKALQQFNKNNGSSISLFNLAPWNRLDGFFEYLYRSQLPTSAYGVPDAYHLERAGIFLNTLRIFEQLAQYQPVLPQDWRAFGWDTFLDHAIDGSGLFTSGGTYLYDHYIPRPGGANMVPIEQPYVLRQNGLIGSYETLFAVMKNSPNKENAIDLVMLWTQPKIAEKWVDFTKNPTGVRGDINNTLMTMLERESNVYDRFVADMQSSYGDKPMLYYRHPLHAFGKECPIQLAEFRESLALILEGQLTADEYYQEIMARLQMTVK